MNSSSQIPDGLYIGEAFDLLSNTTALTVFYGISFTLYLLCARLLYHELREPDRQRQAQFSLGYISLVFICITAFVILSSRTSQLAYVDNANFPGEQPIQYELSYDPTIESYKTATAIFHTIVETLTMVIQIWRLWVVWSGTLSRYAVAVTALPLVLLFAFVGLEIPYDVISTFMPLDQLGVPRGMRVKMGTVTYAILPAFSVLVTVLVIVRLLLIRRRHIGIMGMSEPTASPYLGVAATLIESYALESAWSLGSAVSIGAESPSYALFITNDAVVKVIAYFLVVYRVAGGGGWTRDTERKLTSMPQWNHGEQTTTSEANGIRSQAPTMTALAVDQFAPLSKSVV